jgi:hypothetical protein
MVGFFIWFCELGRYLVRGLIVRRLLQGTFTVVGGRPMITRLQPDLVIIVRAAVVRWSFVSESAAR